MIRIIIMALMITGTAIAAVASDSCIECHGNRQKMESVGYGGFAVTSQEAGAQTRMPARCDQCHLGNPDKNDSKGAHKGMARLHVVSKKGLKPMSSARRFPLEYGTNPMNRVYAVTVKDGKQVQEMVSGFIRTATFIEANPVLAAKGSTKILGQKAEIIEKVLTTPRDRLSFLNLVPNKADFTATQDYMVKFGITKNKVDIAGYLDDRFARRAV